MHKNDEREKEEEWKRERDRKQEKNFAARLIPFFWCRKAHFSTLHTIKTLLVWSKGNFILFSLCKLFQNLGIYK